MKKWFVSGAGGVLGSALVARLVERGDLVHAWYHRQPTVAPHPQVRPFWGDLLEASSLRTALQGVDGIFHTAAIVKPWLPDAGLMYRVNVEGTERILQLARELNIPNLVFTSTCGLLGPSLQQPLDEEDEPCMSYQLDYEVSKKMAEDACRRQAAQGLPVKIVAPSRIFGSTDASARGTDWVIQAFLAGKWHILPGNGSLRVNYAYLPDVVEGHIQAMEKGEAGRLYILGGEDVSYAQFFETIRKYSHCKTLLARLPFFWLKTYARLHFSVRLLLRKAPLITPALIDRYQYSTCYSSARAQQELNYRITPFEEAMARTVQASIAHHTQTVNHLKQTMI